MASQAEVADHLDLSQPAVAELVRRGIIKKAPRGAYSLNKCRLAYIRHLRAQAAGRLGDDDGEVETFDLVQERARLAKEQADKTALENKVRRGELVEAAAVVAGWQAVFAHVRAKLLALPSKMAAQVSNLNKPAEIQTKLTEVVHDAIDELARTRGAAIPPDAGSEDRGNDDGGDAGMGVAAKPDGERVGRSKPGSEQRGKQRAG